jgi:DNA-binding GntR family transcriptional regulator
MRREFQPGNRRHGVKGDGVANYLATGIHSGRYAPGQRLVEADLTAELSVSRSLLREAFQRLSAEGLIEIVPNRGALVRRLSIEEAVELFAIRVELEALAARLAAANISDPCIRHRFETGIASIWNEDPRFSTSEYISENRRFHESVFAAAGNGQLIKLNHQLQLSLIMAQISSELTGDIIQSSLDEHRAIADAILDGNVEAADAAIRNHLRRALAVVQSMPKELFRRDSQGASVVDTFETSNVEPARQR